ncbi:MAG: hypothetical protein DRI77_05635 [Chloroflexi bacterium]|nr:MAG: hypothetical protein DRI77_05635 [Chloroflexota bacterium]
MYPTAADHGFGDIDDDVEDRTGVGVSGSRSVALVIVITIAIAIASPVAVGVGIATDSEGVGSATSVGEDSEGITRWTEVDAGVGDGVNKKAEATSPAAGDTEGRVGIPAWVVVGRAGWVGATVGDRVLPVMPRISVYVCSPPAPTTRKRYSCGADGQTCRLPFVVTSSSSR